MSGFAIGAVSRSKLDGVHPKLVDVVERAIAISVVDFVVIEGIRSIGKQAELYTKGVSKTLKSKHLKQGDGYGHAVDLVPYVNGKIDWQNLEGFREIKKAMFEAASQVGVELRWGNDWNRNGVEVEADPRESFADWPHFELWRA